MKTTLYDFYDIVSPDAGAMIESLRAFGYHLDTSIADIIDNSISAHAKNIWIDCAWNGEQSTISIRDDGHGMTDDVLKEAMRPGTTNPLQERDPKDLGRFGLGLKTASFSQCRKLTVGSRTDKTPVALWCWDLDYVNDEREWRLVKPNSGDEHPVFSSLNNMKSGTIVLWERIDRLTKDTSPESKTDENHFYAELDILKKHLSMVFHRFLEKPAGLKIFLNQKPVKAWDPFLRDNQSTQHLPQEVIKYRDKSITIRPYVLPHRSKLDDDEYENAGGPGGWNERQGFYLYRNERLIVPGDWFGLTCPNGLTIRKDQHNKLARIMVDIPNSFDGDWKIDVKKSVARPPNKIKKDFQKIARLTLRDAIRVYSFRGKYADRKNEPLAFPWTTSIIHGSYQYKINRDHPLIADILQNSGESRKKIQSMLRIIEETVPVPLIILNSSSNPDKIQRPFEDTPSEDLMKIMEDVWNSLKKTGIPSAEAEKRLKNMEPFSDYPSCVSTFIEQKRS